jgi:hypothetical protein
MADTKRYYAISGVEFLESEEDVIRALREDGDYDAQRVCVTDVPAWEYLDENHEERLIATARQRDYDERVSADRLERAARAIASQDGVNPITDWTALPPTGRTMYLGMARAALQAAEEVPDAA